MLAVLCYKCQQRGHIARDCPNVGQFGTNSEAKAPKVCVRCGRGSCAAAGLADYHRCFPLQSLSLLAIMHILLLPHSKFLLPAVVVLQANK